MMGLGRADSDAMSLLEYQARLYHWNKAHQREETASEKSVHQVPPEVTQRLIDQMRANPALLGPNPPGFGKPAKARMGGANLSR